MNRNALIATLSVCATTIVVSGIVANAGSLNPSTGPITPTGPTIIDSLPFIIVAPGAYVVRSDLVGVAADNGIFVNVSDVTIDLGGFSIIGVPNAGAGIVNAVAVENVSVRNGTFRDWPTYGVFLPGVAGCELHDVRARANGLGGVWVGDAATLDGVTTTGIGGIGITTGQSCLVTDSSASGHTGRGVLVGDATTLRDVIATDNGAAGIETGATCVVTNSSAKDNTNAGIVLGNDSTATACSSSNNGNNGFFGFFGVTIESCSAQLNANDGFRASSGSSITRCTARANSGDGIEVVSNCLVTHNNCSDNGQDPLLDGAGVNATGSDNRVESNHLVNNTRGVLLAGTGTYMNDNTVRANTLDNYDLADGNLVNILLCEVHEAIRVPASVKFGGTLIGTDTSFGAHGVAANSRNVWVDLAGHALIGVDNPLDSQDGIVGADAVRNGFIQNWTGLGAVNTAQGLVLDVIGEPSILNPGGITERCKVDGGSIGGNIVSHCVSNNSFASGLSGRVISESVSSGANTLDNPGQYGIRGDVVVGCASILSGQDGIDADLITNCYSANHTGAGFRSPGLIRGNRSLSNGSNFNNVGGATIIENDTP